MKWLASHDEAAMYDHEIHSMQTGKPAELIRLLHELKPGYYYKRDGRSVLSNFALDNLQC